MPEPESIDEINISSPKNSDIIFLEGSRELGKLTLSDSGMTFSGNAEESAKVFFQWLKPMIDNYIETQLAKKEGGEKCQKQNAHMAPTA